MWYVIHTVSGMEQKCLQQCGIHLDRDDYNEIFIPRYIAQKHFKKEWHEVEKALFPGYLFVDTEKIESVIEGLKKFRQYTKVLREGKMVSPITVQEQQFLSIMMDQQHLVRYSEGFLIGEKVCITTGPLKNFEGYIRTVDRHRRVAKLEIPIFGRPTPTEVGFGAMKRVSEKEFRCMIEKNIQKYKGKSQEKAGKIRVLRGVFKGMTGKFLHADVGQDEWTVELKLFGVETRVAFRREEIKIFI